MLDTPPPPFAPAPAGPTGPPTPPIPLTALLAREELGLRRIAGPDRADVLWVHTSEMADPYPYLLGGELLLSAGVLLTDPDRYVARLVEAGASALGFGVRPVHETVPQALVEACERHGLPLLEVPPATPFTAIARAVWQLMAEARHRELRRVNRAQQALASAAARPDAVPALLHQLAAQLTGRAVLLTARGEEIHAAGRRPPPEAAAALTRLARVVARQRPGSPASATDAHGGTHLSAYALGGGEGLVLALAAPQREPGDHTVAGIAAVLLSLLAAPHQGADAAGRSAALVRLLLGSSPAEVAPLLAPGGTDGRGGRGGRGGCGDPGDVGDVGGSDDSGGSGGLWTVVHARRTDGSAADALTAGALGAALGSALVDAGRDGGDAVRVLVPVPGATAGAAAADVAGRAGVAGPAASGAGRSAEARRSAVATGAEVAGAEATGAEVAASEEPASKGFAPEATAATTSTPATTLTPQPGWTLGASAPTPVTALDAADALAARALAHAEATRAQLAVDTPASGGLAALVPPEQAAAHARALLAPLTSPLAATLRCWLSLHGNWDRTAVALSVHRNTVRQRVRRCGELLGMDLDDMDVRAELWFALRQG
ncbi:PucR family transcriptional regulator [Streptomyces pratensis]|uniref:PucR family transcriptional regulator n=1 Tax=Streptomyces pratensis TaxID=1169025 RepID=UPI0030178EF3